MALGFTQSIPYTYWKVILSCITSVIIIFILIIHIRGYCKYGQQNSYTTFKDKYLNAYSIVNIVTIITILLYAIGSCMIFLSKFDLIINVISCKNYNDISAVNTTVQFLQTHRISRRNGGLSSKYEYNRENCCIWMFLLVQSVINVPLHIQTQYGSKYSAHDLFYACQCKYLFIS